MRSRSIGVMGMPGEESNDNASPLGRHVYCPDAHGHAALLLVESLIHTLIARSLLSVADAVEIVESAGEVTEELVDGRDGSQPSPGMSLELIRAISRSLSHDLPPK